MTESRRVAHGSMELEGEVSDNDDYDGLTLGTSSNGLDNKKISVLDRQLLNEEVIAQIDEVCKESYLLATNQSKKRNMDKDEDTTKQQLKVLSHTFQTVIG